MLLYPFLLSVAILLVCFPPSEGRFDPTWDSLDKRPLPPWYDEVKIGIFIHWGVFSVPSFGSEWFWEDWQGTKNSNFTEFMEKNYKPGITYPSFAESFTAEFYNPNDWAELFEKSGAQYVVLTSKHHEGYTLWPSSVSWNWNSMDVGPKRDLLGDLANAIRNKTKLRFGVYHSLYEWFNPLYLEDKRSGWKSRKFVERKTYPELIDLVETYKPEVVWSDGDWEAPYTYWNSTGFLAWLYNDSPVKDTVVVNDRWGIEMTCHHGDFYTCQDRYNPGKLIEHKWENAMTLDRYSWGYRRNGQYEDYFTSKELIYTVIQTVSCNGNILINVGPTKDGIIAPIFEDRLLALGKWLLVNGEAIYSTKPWTHQNDTVTKNVWYTSKGSTVYAFVLGWPQGNSLLLGAVQNLPDDTQIGMLGVEGSLKWGKTENGSTIVQFPTLTPDLLPCEYSWALKIENVPSLK